MVDGIAENSKRSATTLDLQVGARVRERRMILGWSQEKLAETLGLTFQQVQKYEKGHNRIGAGRLFEISQLLDVPISYFYANIAVGEIQEQAASPVVEMLKTREGIAMANAFCRISDVGKRRALVGVAQAMSRLPIDPDDTGDQHDPNVVPFTARKLDISAG